MNYWNIDPIVLIEAMNEGFQLWKYSNKWRLVSIGNEYKGGVHQVGNETFTEFITRCAIRIDSPEYRANVQRILNKQKLGQ